MCIVWYPHHPLGEIEEFEEEVKESIGHGVHFTIFSEVVMLKKENPMWSSLQGG